MRSPKIRSGEQSPWSLLSTEEAAEVETAIALRHLDERPTDSLPEDEVLLRFADGTLTGDEREAVRRLAARNVMAALAIGGFVREYTPVRELALGWAGWKGAALAALDRLPESVSSKDWGEHCERCPRSAKRTEIARRWLGREQPREPGERQEPVRRRRSGRWIAAAAVAGWAVAAVLVIFPQILPRSDELLSPHPRGFNTGPGPGPAARNLEDWMFPTSRDPEELRLRSEVLEEMLGRRPESRRVRETLAEYYLQRARLTRDREERARLEQRARLAIESPRELLSDLESE